VKPLLKNDKPPQQINWDFVEEYLRKELSLQDELGLLEVKPFTSGYSNLTFIVRIGKWEGVLRRPPSGELPQKTHDMKREYNILTNIHPVYPKAPKPFLYCDDRNVMDKHFYVMELKKGIVIDDSLPSDWKNLQSKQQLSEAFIQELADLHKINIYINGLENIGRPEGFLERQVHGWIKRYQLSKTHEYSFVPKLEHWLIENIPVSTTPTLIHNDFKLNNMMFHPANPNQVTALFDWEMSTIGDPLFDLAISLAYWKEEGEADTGLTAVTNQSGFLKRKEIAKLYAKATGFDLSNIDYYLCFAFYKIAVILQQLYYRDALGGVNDNRFTNLNVGIKNLLLQAKKAIYKNML
jgi:aminoglycoside phosphotransferase (APT) family kinase protein